MKILHRKTEGLTVDLRSTDVSLILGHGAIAVRSVQTIAHGVHSSINMTGDASFRKNGYKLIISSHAGVVEVDLIAGHLPSLRTSQVRDRSGQLHFELPNQLTVIMELETDGTPWNEIAPGLWK